MPNPNTVQVTEKPIPDKVSQDAYVLGMQDNGKGQQALYRLPISEIQGNGILIEDADDNASYLAKFRISGKHLAVHFTEV